jgi:hypothetical protein
MRGLRDLTVLIANDRETNIFHGTLETNTVSISIDQALGRGAAITKGTKTSLFVYLGLTQGAMNDCLEDRLLVIRSSTGNAMKSDTVPDRLVRYVPFLCQQIRGTGLA